MIPFLFAHAVVATLIAAYLLDQRWAFALPTWAFFAGLVIDQLFAAREGSRLEPDAWARGGRLVLFAWAPLHLVAVLCGLHAASTLPQDSYVFWSRLLSICISIGMVGGTLGGALAHELMHVNRTVDRIVGTGLMSLMTYGHFAISHVAGHHRLVGTSEDPATARRGESVYAFLPRALAGGVALAWRAEVKRLRRGRRPVWSVENRMLRIFGWEALFYAAIAVTVGWAGVVFFALQGLIGASLLEVTNYVQHYGLQRRRLPSGRTDIVRPQCSWNTRRLATTYLLCGIGLHSHHHCRPSKPFPSLTLSASAPQLPGGLFAMFVLAWFPPLWRSVMDPLVDVWTSPRQPSGVKFAAERL